MWLMVAQYILGPIISHLGPKFLQCTLEAAFESEFSLKSTKELESCLAVQHIIVTAFGLGSFILNLFLSILGTIVCIPTGFYVFIIITSHQFLSKEEFSIFMLYKNFLFWKFQPKKSNKPNFSSSSPRRQKQKWKNLKQKWKKFNLQWEKMMNYKKYRSKTTIFSHKSEFCSDDDDIKPNILIFGSSSSIRLFTSSGTNFFTADINFGNSHAVFPNSILLLCLGSNRILHSAGQTCTLLALHWEITHYFTEFNVFDYRYIKIKHRIWNFQRNWTNFHHSFDFVWNFGWNKLSFVVWVFDLEFLVISTKGTSFCSIRKHRTAGNAWWFRQRNRKRRCRNKQQSCKRKRREEKENFLFSWNGNQDTVFACFKSNEKEIGIVFVSLHGNQEISNKSFLQNSILDFRNLFTNNLHGKWKCSKSFSASDWKVFIFIFLFAFLFENSNSIFYPENIKSLEFWTDFTSTWGNWNLKISQKMKNWRKGKCIVFWILQRRNRQKFWKQFKEFSNLWGMTTTQSILTL